MFPTGVLFLSLWIQRFDWCCKAIGNYEIDCLEALMNIAILGDLHGRVLFPFYLVSRWKQEHCENISYALCTGDVLHGIE